MELLEKFRKSIMFFMKILVVATVTTAFIGVWQNYYNETLYSGRGNYLLVSLYIAIFVTFGSIYDGFKVGIMRLHELVYSLGLAILFANGFIYIILSLVANRMLNPLPLVALTLLQVVMLVVLMYSLSNVYFALHKPRSVLTVFDPNVRNDIIKKVSLIKDRFDLAKGITVDRGIDEIKNEIDGYETILICDLEAGLKNEVLRYCYAQNKRIYMLPSSADTVLNGSYPVQIFDTPILFLKDGGLSTEQRIIKRIFDIVFSGIFILLTLPLMFIIAILVKSTSRGPVIFKQPRVTLNGKVFNIYKFRSMRVLSDEELKKTTVHDDRITFAGKIIRPFRLDELPQLFNIFFGHMSVVGPRPEMVELVEEYSRMLPDFQLRHKVKAGLTGYAQIYGKYNTTPQNKLNMDLHYIEHYSLLQDIKLCAMTLKIMFVKSSTEGFSDSDSKVQNNNSEKMQ